MIKHLQHANQIAIQSVQSGHHPFGAILISADHETVLLEQGNVDTVNHAEAVLIGSGDRRNINIIKIKIIPNVSNSKGID